jgi:hypothetical protein
MATTDSTWGKEETPQELRDALNKAYMAQDENGQEKKIIQI